MFHHLWRNASPSQASADSRIQQRPRQRRWIYGVGALIPLLISLLTVVPAFAASGQWSGWFPPASVPLATFSAPAAAEYNTGQFPPGCTFLCTPILVQYIFARQSDHTIDFSTSTFSGSGQGPWTALSPVPGGGHTPNAPTAAQLGSKLYLFVQGPDNLVWVNTFNGINWSGWQHIVTSTQELVPTPSGPYVTAYQGALFLFVREGDGTIHMTKTVDGITWTKLNEVPSGGHTPNTPTAAVFGNTLYVMVQGPDNFVWINTFDGATWSEWSQPLSNGMPIATSTSPAGGPDSHNDFHLIVRESDGSIEESVTPDGSTWSSPHEVPSNGRTPSAPAIMEMTPWDSGLFLFAQGPDNTIAENVFSVNP